MSRCNCESGTTCACKVQAGDTDCIDVTVSGTGTLVSPYEISAVPIIDPAAGNQLSCGASGLIVPAAAAQPHVIEDEGVPLTQRPALNFVGDSVVATDDAGGNETDVTINHLATAAHSVAQPITIRENSGADVGTRPRLNLIEGTNITLTVTDDAVDNEVDITIDGAPTAFGGAPPAVSTGASSAGVAATSSRSDHTHSHDPPACRVFHNTTQSLTNATFTRLACNSEVYDTDTMHDTVTNNTRITFNTAGIYIVTATIHWAPDTDYTDLVLFLVRNGTGVDTTDTVGRWRDLNPGVAGLDRFGTVATQDKFNAGDWVDLVARQSNTSAAANNITTQEFSAGWFGRG